jgi:hypothetical protein
MNNYKRAGKSTREMAKKRHATAIWIAVIGIALIIVIWVLLKNSTALKIGGIGVLILLFSLKVLPDIIDTRIGKKLKEEKRAIRGAVGEEKIGEILSGLSSDFCVLHDIESPYGNIDHIVLSKSGGVFLIETKAHGGKVWVEGDELLVNGKSPEKNFIAQALKNSYWLRDEIGEITGSKPWITPVLVFTNAFVSPTRPIKGVNITNKKFILSFLQRTTKSSDANTQVWNHKDEIIKSLYNE